MTARGDELRTAVTNYIDGGAVPVRVEPREKKPLGGTGWGTLRPGPADFADNDNVGLLVGEASGLLDVDCDCAEAVALAPYFLPPTLTHGRASVPVTHYWYRAVGPTRCDQHKDPSRGAGEPQMVVELRGGKLGDQRQTVVPPSVHPSGEVLEWDTTHAPADVPYDELRGRVRRLAAASLLARHWKTPRAECSLALAGALVRGGWSDEDAIGMLTAISSYVNQNDGEPAKRARHVASSRARLENGENVTGFPKLEEIGVPGNVVRKVRSLLGLQGDYVSTDGFRGPASASPASNTSAGDDAPTGERAPWSWERDFDASDKKLVTELQAQLTGKRGTMIGDIAARDVPPVRVFKSGDPGLDALIGGGFYAGEVTAIAAPPSLGKSSKANGLALKLSEDVPVLNVSAELMSRDVSARVAAQILDVPITDIIRGVVPRARVVEALRDRRIRVLGQDDLRPPSGARVEAVLQQARAVCHFRGRHLADCEVTCQCGNEWAGLLPLRFDERFVRAEIAARFDALEVIARTAREMHAEYGVAPVIVLDYLQRLARGGDAAGGLRESVDAISLDFLNLVQELDTVGIAVVTVNRETYRADRIAKMRKEGDPRAYLSVPKESGAIESDAANLLVIDADETDASGARDASIVVARARHGREGFVGYKFYGATGRWVADPAARARMLTGDKRKADEESTNLRRQVIEYLDSKAPGPRTRDEIKDALGVGRNGRVNAIVAELLDDPESGVVECGKKPRVWTARAAQERGLEFTAPLPRIRSAPPPPPSPVGPGSPLYEATKDEP